jgi:hypothetical protein
MKVVALMGSGGEDKIWDMYLDESMLHARGK